METPAAHMHVLGIAIVDPDTAPAPFTFDRVKALVRARLPLLPAFRRRLVPVPLGLHYPLWVEDPDFDLDFHMRRIALPAPGGPDELNAVIADLAGRPLDRAKPLWELWYIEGLEAGHVALVAKVHHAAIDGIAGVGILATLFDLEPDAPLTRDAPDVTADTEPERVPSELELIGYGVASLARQPLKFAGSLGHLGSAAMRLVRRVVDEQLRVAAPLTAPRLAMNGVITPHRKVAFASLSLADVKVVKNAFGVTVNDVLLAVTAGALRSYLQRRGELPERPLVAAVPIAAREGSTEITTGNVVSAMFSALDVQIEDPVERVRAIHRSTYGAKHVHAEVGGSTLGEWAELAAPVWFGRAVRLFSSLRIADRFRPIINLVVSNVPGPPFPLYLAGAQLVSVSPLGPIFDGCGLNVTVISYLDKIDVGFLACRELMPDLDQLAAAVPDALAELRKAADDVAPAP
jgi:WS/DGAT/MGAT family acyltransferase